MKNSQSNEQWLVSSIISFIVIFFTTSPMVKAAATAAEVTVPAVAGPDFTKAAIALLFVVVLLIVALLLIKRMGYTTSCQNNDAFSLIACMPLSANDRLLLIKVAETVLLIGYSQGNMTCLHVFSEEINTVAQQENNSEKFMQTLKQSVQQPSTQS